MISKKGSICVIGRSFPKENKIENNRSIVVLNLETSELLTGKYKINLKNETFIFLTS